MHVWHMGTLWSFIATAWALSSDVAVWVLGHVASPGAADWARTQRHAVWELGAPVYRRGINAAAVLAADVLCRADAANAASQPVADVPPRELSGTELEPAAGDEDDRGGGGSSSRWCNVCYEKPVDTAILHAGTAHYGFCQSCVLELRRRGLPCPACSRRIESCVRVYDM